MFAILIALSLSQTKRLAGRYSLARSKKLLDRMDESVVCKFCLDAIDMIDDLLADDKLEEEIIQLVDEYCQKLPTPYSSLCVAYVESGIPLAISYIKDGIDTFDICGRFGLCDPTKASSFPHKTRRPSNPNKNIPQQVKYTPVPQIKIAQSGYDKKSGCEMCYSILDYIEQLKSENTIEDKISSLISEKCGTYQSPYSSICNTLVRQYFSYFTVWVDGKITHSDICTKIGICEI